MAARQKGDDRKTSNKKGVSNTKAAKAPPVRVKGGKRNTKATKAPPLQEKPNVFAHLMIAYLGGLLSGLTLDQWELISGFLIALIAPMLAWVTQASAN